MSQQLKRVCDMTTAEKEEWLVFLRDRAKGLIASMSESELAAYLEQLRSTLAKFKDCVAKSLAIGEDDKWNADFMQNQVDEVTLELESFEAVFPR
jgi:hypothetical protein